MKKQSFLLSLIVVIWFPLISNCQCLLDSSFYTNINGLSKTINQYDAKGRTINTESYYQNYNKTKWIGSYKQEYVIDNYNDTICAKYYYSFDTVYNKWVGSFKIDLKYNNHKTIETIQQIWDTTNNWRNEKKIEKSYGTNNSQISEYEYKWNLNKCQWEGITGYNKKIDSDGNLLQEEFERWDSVKNDWIIVSSMKYLHSDSCLITEHYSINVNQWINLTKRVTSLDTSNYKTMVFYEWDTLSNSWVYSSKSSILIDSLNRIIGEAHFYPDSAKTHWINKNKLFFTFDNRNRNTSHLEYKWNEISKSWDGSLYFKYNFTDTLNSCEIINYVWDTLTNAWKPNTKTTRIQNNHNFISYFGNSIWKNDQWILISKSEYTFLNDSCITEILKTKLDTVSNVWINISKSTKQYDANNNLVNDESFSWKNGTWVTNKGAKKTTYEYDENNRLIRTTEFRYLINYLNNWKLEFEYDSIGNIVKKSIFSGNTSNNWDLTEETKYFFSCTNVYNKANSELPTFIFFPNPSKKEINFENIGNSSIFIYSITGQCVLSTDANSGFVNVNIENLKSGSYIVKIIGDNTNHSCKFLKIE